MGSEKKSTKKENIKSGLAEVFSDTLSHIAIAKIIKTHLTNSSDIRKIALQTPDISKAQTILDVGCGFGYFTGGLKGFVHPDAEVTGVDMHVSYEKHFLESCRKTGLKGKFDSNGIAMIKQFDNRSLDLVISSYSLYFFPEYIGRISNLLKEAGHFVVIAHAIPHMFELTSFVKEVLDDEGIGFLGELPYESLLRNFSSENGMELLMPYFSHVESFTYKSTLIFKDGDLDNLLKYFRFKESFFLPENDINHEQLIRIVTERVKNEMKLNGQFNITKDDCIFICSGSK